MVDRVRVLLVDRPTLFRASLQALLQHRNLCVVGQAENGAQAASQAGALHPDVAVVDPAVPEGGPPMIASVRETARGCGVLVLSDDSDENSVNVALLAGARGYLHKDCAPDDLVRAIHSVRAGELVLAPRLTSVILRAADPSRLLLGAADFAHGMAEFGGDRSAEFGEHDGDGGRRVLADRRR